MSMARNAEKETALHLVEAALICVEQQKDPEQNKKLSQLLL